MKTSNIDYMILKSKKKLSVKENFEIGLKNCKSDYIFFSDQDDVWESNKIKNVMEVFYKTNSCLVFSNALVVDDKLQNLGCNLWEKIGYKNNSSISTYEKMSLDYILIILKHNIVTGMCMAITSELKEKVIPFSNYDIHDAWIANNAIFFGKVTSINKNLSLYRQHDNNAIGAKKNIKKTFNNRNKYYDNVKNRIFFIENLIENIEKNLNIIPDFQNIYKEYMEYLNYRIEYMNRKKYILNIFFMKKKYVKFEYRPKLIMLKDIYIYIMNKGRN